MLICIIIRSFQGRPKASSLRRLPSKHSRKRKSKESDQQQQQQPPTETTNSNSAANDDTDQLDSGPSATTTDTTDVSAPATAAAIGDELKASLQARMLDKYSEPDSGLGSLKSENSSPKSSEKINESNSNHQLGKDETHEVFAHASIMTAPVVGSPVGSPVDVKQSEIQSALFSSEDEDSLFAQLSKTTAQLANNSSVTLAHNHMRPDKSTESSVSITDSRENYTEKYNIPENIPTSNNISTNNSNNSNKMGSKPKIPELFGDDSDSDSFIFGSSISKSKIDHNDVTKSGSQTGSVEGVDSSTVNSNAPIKKPHSSLPNTDTKSAIKKPQSSVADSLSNLPANKRAISLFDDDDEDDDLFADSTLIKGNGYMLSLFIKVLVNYE